MPASSSTMLAFFALGAFAPAIPGLAPGAPGLAPGAPGLEAGAPGLLFGVSSFGGCDQWTGEEERRATQTRVPRQKGARKEVTEC